MFNKIFKTSSKKFHSFAIADFGKDYVKLIVTYYHLSTFYVVFNQKLSKTTHGRFWFRSWRGSLLNKLIKQANQELGIVLKNISYNFPTDSIQIKLDYTYYHRFSKPTILRPKHLDLLMRDLLKTAYQTKHTQYLNFSFQPQSYFLPDKQKKFDHLPQNTLISSFNICGILYQIDWRTLADYVDIFRTLKVKPNKPVLLPYAIYVNALLLFKKPQVVIHYWTNNKVTLFYFENHIYLKQTSFNFGLQTLFSQIAQKFDISYEDSASYFFNLIQLGKHHLSDFEKILLTKKPRLKIHYEAIIDLCVEFFQKSYQTLLNYTTKEWKLDEHKISILLVGKITLVNQIIACLQKVAPHIDLITFNSNFIGLTDYEDNFLIGNAYYEHLQKKIQDEKSQSD